MTSLFHRHYALGAAILLLASAYISRCEAFGIAKPVFSTRQISRPRVPRTATNNNDESSSSSTVQSSSSKAPTLNGKMVLPYKVIKSGLKGHEIAAVYAVLNSNYKRGSGDGWEHCEYVGVTGNLDEALQLHVDEHGDEKKVAHVRALSFSFPQPDAMKDVASQWKEQVRKAGGSLNDWNTEELLQDDRTKLAELMEHTAFYDEDDDEWDDEEEDLRMEMQQQQPNRQSTGDVVSPFEKSESTAETVTKPSPSTEGTLTFTKDNVDKVLDEVRPYLISDGGNVAVQSVDEQSKNVYLVLEGACGSCASSTVTMQMGIERVLKEKFPELNQVIQVEDPATAASKRTELTLEAVEAEVNRIKPAIIAMGGVVQIVKVDPVGTVLLKYHGSNKVRQGLELAIRDVEYVKHVEFVM